MAHHSVWAEDAGFVQTNCQTVQLLGAVYVEKEQTENMCSASGYIMHFHLQSTGFHLLTDCHCR